MFGPVVEEDAGAFLTANPFYIIQSGHYNRVPWMAGVVTDEGIVRGAGLYRDTYMHMHWLTDTFKMDNR